MIDHCEWCGRPLPDRSPAGKLPRLDRKYCSNECGYASRIHAEREARLEAIGDGQCLHCATPIPCDVTLKRKFCQKKCRRDYYNAIRSKAVLASKLGRTCLTCGASIALEKKEGTRFCSRNCNARHHQRRKRAEAKRTKG
ncbi:hypothetical protein NBRC116599_37000 [Aquicoccus sp. SU-CL01552]